MDHSHHQQQLVIVVVMELVQELGAGTWAEMPLWRQRMLELVRQNKSITTQELVDALQEMRIAIRAKTGNAVTAGFGPRFQHSCYRVWRHYQPG